MVCWDGWVLKQVQHDDGFFVLAFETALHSR